MRFQFTRLDAAENVFLERELEHVKATAYEVRYPELRAREFIPVAYDTPSGTETIVYQEYDAVGTAKLIASYSDDLPRVDVLSREVRAPVRGLGDSYGYSRQEIRAAMQARRPLVDRKARMARRAIEILVDEIASTGHVSGLKGLLNIANALGYTVPADGTGTSALWSTKSADLILRDLNGIVAYMVAQTKGVERPNTILLPEPQYDLIAGMPRSTVSDTTVLEFWRRTRPEITLDKWHRCAGAGASSTNRMVAYRKAPEVLWLEMPLEFDQTPPEQRGLSFVVACEARTGGVICPLPLAIAYGDGL
jgi:hypothetical protein